MFGAILGLFGIGGKLIHDTKGSIFDSGRKSNAIQQGNNTYIDRHGKERSIYTNNIVWDTYDKDGYNVTIDSKTREILRQDQRHNFENKRKEAKEKAIRAGDEAYGYYVRKRNKYGMPDTIYEYRRTKDDKIVKLKGGYYVTPIFELIVAKNNYIVRKNRCKIYKYCRDWYVDKNRLGNHPNEMINEAKEYGVVIFEDDIEYCLQKIDESIKNGGECILKQDVRKDRKYCEANWVNERDYIDEFFRH